MTHIEGNTAPHGIISDGKGATDHPGRPQDSPLLHKKSRARGPAFVNSFLVTTDGPRGEEFHHLYAYTYPTAEGISTFTGKEDLSEVEAIWKNVGADQLSPGIRLLRHEPALARPGV